MKSLTVEDIQEYLTYIKLERFSPEFKENIVNGRVLLGILKDKTNVETAMEELGVVKKVHQIRIRTMLPEFIYERLNK